MQYLRIENLVTDSFYRKPVEPSINIVIDNHTGAKPPGSGYKRSYLRSVSYRNSAVTSALPFKEADFGQ